MSPPPRHGRPPLLRTDLPVVFTPATLRELDLSTLRRLSQRDNGILSANEQREFDAALREVMHGTTDRLDRSLRRFGRDRAPTLDPELRGPYLRTRERLAAQAERARASFPQLTDELDAVVPVAPAEDAGDDVSLGTFESEVEEASDLLVLLERIASIEQQQLEHQRSQALRDLRGVFFALLVSVAVIVAGIAPLVEAEPHERGLILLWTLVVCAVAGVVYAIVRAAESRRSDPDTS